VLGVSAFDNVDIRARVGYMPEHDCLPSEVSGERVKLCQALVHDPAFVFLDEPTAGLDPAGREEMLTLIRKTHREFGISVLFSSHLMADVERTCDRIIVLRGGRLVRSGEVAQFTKETEAVFIEVDTNRDALMSALERRGVSVTTDGRGLTVEGTDESVYEHVRDALVEAEAPLRRMAPRRGELAELFERDAK
jgi:ABC-2 type transport system ATP-binding protein